MTFIKLTDEVHHYGSGRELAMIQNKTVSNYVRGLGQKWMKTTPLPSYSQPNNIFPRLPLPTP